MQALPTRRRLYEYNRDGMSVTDCWQTRNNHCQAHFHASVELVYVFSGTLHVMLDAQSFAVPAGRLLLVSAYTVHTYQTLCDNSEMIIIIPPAVVPSLQKPLVESVFSNPVLDLTGDEKLLALLALFQSGWNDYSAATQKGLSYALLGMLIERVGLTPLRADTRKGLMQDVLIYLQDHYQQPLRMEMLAQRFGYSKSRFSHLFNETLGCPPGAFINALRCQHAARAMLESDQTLLEIAMGAGFECPRTFYRAFKQYYGVTPTQYVSAHRPLRRA